MYVRMCACACVCVCVCVCACVRVLQYKVADFFLQNGSVNALLLHDIQNKSSSVLELRITIKSEMS